MDLAGPIKHADASEYLSMTDPRFVACLVYRE